jgi:pilus assembly protein CpaF
MNEKLAPLFPILYDPEISEVLIEGWQNVRVMKNGILMDWPNLFANEVEVYDVIEGILEPLGRIANESNPIQDVRLADGTLVNVVIPPIAVNGPSITIRKKID